MDNSDVWDAFDACVGASSCGIWAGLRPPLGSSLAQRSVINQRWLTVYIATVASSSNETIQLLNCICCKNVAHTRLPTVPELIPIHGSQHAGDVSHRPGGRLPLLSARPAFTLATLKRAATNFAAWWTEARWVWTVCLRLLSDSVAAAIWTLAFCAWVQHANYSATEPPSVCCNDANNIFFCFRERYWTAPSYFPSSVLVKSL